MKARTVKGLDPAAPLADSAERILRVRVAELHGFLPQALDPNETRALHDLRIAAKRLRYLLELTGFCFGAYASTAAKRARELQDLIGEIHDCDVMLPRVLAHLEELRRADAAALRQVANGAPELDPSLARLAPHRTAYRGLEVLAAHLGARRALLFERFVERWGELERGDFRDRLEQALGERNAEASAAEPAADGRVA